MGVNMKTAALGLCVPVDSLTMKHFCAQKGLDGMYLETGAM